MSSPPKQWAESPFLRSLLAGALAGTTVDLSLYPIDTLKTRLQSSAGFFPSGGFTGIYRGIGSAVVGSAPGAALFFVTYDTTKRALARPKPAYTATGTPYAAPPSPAAEPLIHMAAATAGEIAACAVRVPTEVVKQRAQAVQFPSSAAALRDILGRYGTAGIAGVWRELYRGWGVTIMREVPFTVIQFPLWEGLKAWSLRRSGRAGDVGAAESALYGSVSGAVAAGVTTPLDVLKTRLMLSRERVGAAEMLARIVKESGARALFAGIGPRVLWISGGGAIFLGSYQWASNKLSGEVVKPL
ncbi:mitochondrial carrier [Trichodelitschia bisporula]|uniref:Mitochondrial carrier n=1 Tax=Trichodelitschia bisporula TaxID=703511 RepID=A0A6G1HZC0_9PEZI|nr:mitochondrial carrier [Trichodelitschia bisporula]